MTRWIGRGEGFNERAERKLGDGGLESRLWSFLHGDHSYHSAGPGRLHGYQSKSVPEPP
jgi:hypothetical protein